MEAKIYVHPADVVKDITPADLSGTDVLFINMPLRETAVPNITPQGPLLLATKLRKNYGVHATILDLNGYRIKDERARERQLPNGRHLTYVEAFELIQEHIRIHGKPDFVGFSGKKPAFEKTYPSPASTNSRIRFSEPNSEICARP